MYFAGFSELFTMGRHGAFVWAVYAIVLVSLITMHLISRLRHRHLTRKLRALKHRRQLR